MENASKALLMAGGILIGMIIVSLFVFEMSNMSITAKAYEEEMVRTQVLEFNSRFESYAFDSEGKPEQLKAQQVVTLYNYIIEWNYGGEVNEGHPSDFVELEFKGGIILENYPISSYSIKKEDITGPKKKLKIEELLNQYPESKYYFTCTNIKYGKPEGRIYSMTIECNEKKYK